MAKCEYCGREMTTAKGCTMKYIVAKYPSGWRVIKRERVGDEGWIGEGERCGDCGAEYGQYHHYGCDIERCPVCGMQMIGCECNVDENAPFYLAKTKKAAEDLVKELTEKEDKNGAEE